MKAIDHHIYLKNKNFTDLNPIRVGYAHCPPGHKWGPLPKCIWMIHFVSKGCGTVEKQGQIFHVKAGESFIFTPEELVKYTADLEDPWTYHWIGFDGRMAEDFRRLPPVLPFPNGLLQEIVDASSLNMPEHRIAGLLFRIYAELFGDETQNDERHFVWRIKEHIDTNYMSNIKVETLAEDLRLDRSYLSRAFSKKMGCSIQGYLKQVRMEHAEQFLRHGYSVKETAMLCGYEDASHFSTVFKQVHGVSPIFWIDR